MSIDFAPLVPVWLVVTFAGLAVALTGYAIAHKAGGALWRAGVVALILAALLNPSVVDSEREPLANVAALIVDRSLSQQVAGRLGETETVAAAVRAGLEALPGLDVREVQASHEATDAAASDGTHLFAALDRALGDIPPERVAGAILITDGQVHDIPDGGAAAALGAPIHALNTGRRDERDRKLTVATAPRFGIVGERVLVGVKVEDFGLGRAAEPRAALSVSVDGAAPVRRLVPIGRVHEIDVAVDHGGPNIVELVVEEAPGELTLQNNRAVISVSGVRDRLRVLLVSGEPHPGERTWRNLLKADPSVDLVHFTILRPPEKQDGTPIRELSLIAFPTRELFSIKLHEFDLVIFDRYRRRGVLPYTYLGNVANYVDAGGALLVASGPAFASPLSLSRTPLAAVLPGLPTGEIHEGAYRPRVTGIGSRHPVTEGLPGANAAGDTGEAEWGRWFRAIDVDQDTGEMLMSGPGARPILLLDRVGEGRVAQLLSDHSWLWARGYDGGGPQAELLRRLAHWLMKEPDLEEEDLRATAEDGRLLVVRHSLDDRVRPVDIETPSGEIRTVELERLSGGTWTATLPVTEMGLYRLSDGALRAVTAVGPLNPVELADVRASETRLESVHETTGGAHVWAAEDGIPDIRLVREGRGTAGRGWIGLVDRDESRVTAVAEVPLLPPALVLVAVLAGLALGWRREAR